ncbi:MAG: hypothetical protein ACPLZH_01790 [Minisyncoccales bacterium]
MNIFEFYFNPKETKKNIFYQHFSFLPKNIYEENIGPFFLFFLFKIYSAKEKLFLEDFIRFFKKEFAKNQKRQLVVFKDLLKKINYFLEEKTKEGIPLLGNLNLTIINLKGQNFLFSKIGSIDLFLLRQKRVFNLAKSVKIKKREKIISPFFNHIFLGKILKNDLLFVMNDSLSELWEKEKIFQDLKHLSFFSEISFRKILQAKKEKLKKAIGLCLIFDFSANFKQKEKPISHFLSFAKEFELPFFFYEYYEKIKEKKGILLFFLFLFILFLGLILFS